MGSQIPLPCRALLPAILGILCLTGIASGQGAPPAPADQESDTWDQTESYLARLKLDRLQRELLEKRLFTAPPAATDSQLGLASRLLENYRQQMMATHPADPLSAEGWATRTRTLLGLYPQLDSASIRIALAQAQYLNAEQEFRRWWKAGARLDQATATSEKWQQLEDELERLHRQLRSEYDDQLTALQAFPDEPLAGAQRLQQIESDLAHTNYLTGWTLFLKGITEPQQRTENCQRADQSFREFLQLEPERVLTQLDSKWVDMSSDWNIRALAGLGMTQRGLNHPEQSQHCFQLIAQTATRQATLDQLPQWELNHRLYLQDFRDLDELLANWVHDGRLSEFGQLQLWTEAWYGGQAIQHRAPVVAEQLRAAALAGLARGFHAPQIRTLTKEDQLPPLTDPVLQPWIEAYLVIDQWQGQVVDSGELDRVQQKLQQALVETSPNSHPADRLVCRFLLAEVHLQRRDFQIAVEQSLEVAQEMLTADLPALAARSHWLAISALDAESQLDPAVSLVAMQEIDRLLRQHPGSPFASRATWLRKQMVIRHLDPLQARERWREVPVHDPNIVDARLEVVRLDYDLWLAADPTSQRSSALADLTTAVDQLEQVLPVDDERALRSRLLETQAWIETGAIPVDQIEARLQTLQSRIGQRPPTSLAAEEWNYTKCLLAIRKQDFADAASWLGALADSGRQPGLLQNAAVRAARGMDQQLAAADTPGRDQIQSAAEIFAYLVRILGDDESALTRVPNARVALARLAELQFLLEDYQPAAIAFDKLTRLFPERSSYWQQLARARQSLGEYDVAAEHWRRVANGVTPGGEAWLEAKLELVRCLDSAQDRAAARELLQQTLRLTVDCPRHWRQRLEQLARELEVSIPD